MNSNLLEKTSRDLKISFADSQPSINASVCIPLDNKNNFNEIASQIIETFKIPCFNEKEFFLKLKDFIDNETDKLFDEKVTAELEELKIEDSSDLYNKCCFLLSSRDHPKQNQNLETNDKLYEKYHSLVHSGFLTQTLVNLEFSYAIAVQDLILSRDSAIEDLRSKQTREMEAALQKIGVDFTEDDINALSLKHFEDAENLQLYWDKAISNLKQDQKQEFYEWLLKVYEDFQKGDPDMFYSKLRSFSTVSGKFGTTNQFHSLESDSSISLIDMEESFTINLGAQMKTTHNLRLVAMDMLDLCRPTKSFIENSLTCSTPRRIQTAMSLYSNFLSAMVLLVDNRINSFSGNKLEFAKICLDSTEFHFNDLGIQLDDIRKNILNTQEELPRSVNVTLQVGDFYITKHSNLAEVHVAYHLISDDSLIAGDINSRHPVILGLRNILKLAHLNDIGTISIPLLLIHEMTSDLTMQWCLRRAELVLKCVKGFMIEMASLSPGSEENRTIQFVVPKGISEDLFANLTSMLPNIFRLSNPLILKSNYSVN